MIIDKINKTDYLKFFMQWIYSGFIGSILCIISKQGIDMIFVNMLVTLLYLVCYSFLLSNHYCLEEKDTNVHNAISKGTLWYCVLLSLCSLGHMFQHPIQLFMLSSAVLCTVLPVHIGMCQGIMLFTVVRLGVENNPYDMLFGFMLLLFGMMCATVFVKKKHSYEALFILSGISVAIYFLCNYSKGLQVNEYMILHGLIEGLLNLVILLVVVPFLNRKNKEVIAFNYGEAIEDDFPMVVTMKAISEAKYNHGRKVSVLSYNCGKRIGLNENLACCAGLYYCLNDVDGDSSANHLQEWAEQYELPLDVRRLLAQYHGIYQSITTPEAAMVDLIDEVITKMEAHGEDYTQGFHRQMLIMNVFEELSSSGRYDSSGLSINNFIKIRKYLIEEAVF